MLHGAYDVLVINGLHMQPWSHKAIMGLKNSHNLVGQITHSTTDYTYVVVLV
jgi:ABC-type Zn uptake system ZnuABC Zn-binding protein ZnuA